MKWKPEGLIVGVLTILTAGFFLFSLPVDSGLGDFGVIALSVYAGRAIFGFSLIVYVTFILVRALVFYIVDFMGLRRIPAYSKKPARMSNVGQVKPALTPDLPLLPVADPTASEPLEITREYLPSTMRYPVNSQPGDAPTETVSISPFTQQRIQSDYLSLSRPHHR